MDSSQFVNPVPNNLFDATTDREEPGREGLAELGVDRPAIELDAGILQIDMAQSYTDGGGLT